MTSLINLPPLLSAMPALPADSDALDQAVADCKTDRAEVGSVYLVASQARLDLAVVLGPEVAPRRCWEMLFLAAVAFGDAVGAIAPPELAVHYRWPGEIYINGASCGQARLAMAPELDEAGAPLWLALGLVVAVQPEEEGAEPGVYLDRTTLANEGAVDLTVKEWAEAFARHLLVWIHTWEDSGFRQIHQNWWGRHDPKATGFSWEQNGVRLSGRPIGLDEHGSLLLESEAGTRICDPETLLGSGGEA